MTAGHPDLLDGLRGVSEALDLLYGGSYGRFEGTSSQVSLDNHNHNVDSYAQLEKEGLLAVATVSDNTDQLADVLHGLVEPHRPSILGDIKSNLDHFVRNTERMTANLLAGARRLEAMPKRIPILHDIVISTLIGVVEQFVRSLRIVIVYDPAMVDLLRPEVRSLVMTYKIQWWAYLRSMANLFWSAIRHPLSETTIDLSTGRVLYRF